jgi:hypothetical protein
MPPGDVVASALQPRWREPHGMFMTLHALSIARPGPITAIVRPARPPGRNRLLSWRPAVTRRGIGPFDPYGRRAVAPRPPPVPIAYILGGSCPAFPFSSSPRPTGPRRSRPSSPTSTRSIETPRASGSRSSRSRSPTRTRRPPTRRR